LLGVLALAIAGLLLPFRVTPTIELPARIYAAQAWKMERSGQGTLTTILEDRRAGVSRSYAIRNVERGDVAEFVLVAHLHAGSAVTAGDTLGTLHSALIDSRRAALDGSVAVAASELEALASGEKPERVDEIRTRITQVQDQIELQTRIVSRVEELQAQGLSSEDELDRANTELTALRGESGVLQAQIRVLETGARPADRALARARLAAAQDELAALLRQRAALAVRTPIPGVVMRARSDSVLVSVVDTSQWLIVLPIPVDHLREISDGTRVTMLLPGSRIAVAGTVRSIEQSILPISARPHALAMVDPDAPIVGATEGLPVIVNVSLGGRLLRQATWEWIRDLFAPRRPA
jgi:hypothetical protein